MNEKLKRYEEQLFDIGKRNPLIYFHRDRSSVLKIIYPSNDILFSDWENKEFSFFPSDGYLSILEKNIYTIDDYLELQKYFVDKTILGFKSGLGVRKTLKSIEKMFQLQRVERGVHTLFLAFGFIEYIEENVPVTSPLLLKQVELIPDEKNKTFRLKSLGSDIILNPTLKFKFTLERQITLPEYAQQSLEEYLKLISEIGEKEHFSVFNDVFLGNFSYAKMVMYEDLKAHEEQVANHPQIRKLLGEKINQEYPKDVENPIKITSLDETQRKALIAAREGRSFVLQGPPGTGKSQTITNLIADFMSQGKSVLFISEKQAALEVVYHNLTKVGLEEFVLPLHSYRVDKKEVVEQFHRALTKERSKKNGIQYPSELDNHIAYLENYQEILHTACLETDYTPYEVFTSVSHENKYSLSYEIPRIEKMKKLELKERLQLLNRIEKILEHFGKDYHQYAWYGWNNLDESFDEKQKEQILKDLFKQRSYYDQIRIVLGHKKIQSKKDIDELFDKVKYLEKYKFQEDFYSKNALEEINKIVERYQFELEQLRKQKERILKNYQEDVFLEQWDAILNRIQNHYHSWTRIFKKQYRLDKQKLSSFLNNKARLTFEQMEEDVMLLQKYKVDEVEMLKKVEALKQYVSISSQQLYSFIDDLLIMNQFTKQDLEELSLFAHHEEKDALNGLYKKTILAKKKLESCDEFINSFDVKLFDFEKEDTSIVLEKLNQLLQHLDNSYYLSFLQMVPDLKKKDLVKFIEACTSQNYYQEYSKIYEIIFYQQLAQLLIQKVDLFRRFVQENHDQIQLLTQQEELQMDQSNVERIKLNLEKQIPSLQFVSDGSPSSVILKEHLKKRKQLSLKDFLTKIQPIAFALKPCFMMSPLSVSTFLSEQYVFDVVIFDEASQVFPEDALTSIYRGKQVIIAGDSKQMPPTNFFLAGLDFDEEYNGDEDDAYCFESILDLALAQGFDSYLLKWHYRSRNESLISFSNEHFYENQLVTFPTPSYEKDFAGVHFIYCPNGIYERKKRQNLIEARMVVDEMISIRLKGNRKSIGVIAFSQSQQELIEDILEQTRADNSIIDSLFTNETEPLFIKNLETVQGDERDIILFSIGYGYDENQRFIMNFGPLGKQGGERRLNVAITRARYEVRVISSIHASDIDARRITKKGPLLLKEYLNFAEHPYVVKYQSTQELAQVYQLEIEEILKKNKFVYQKRIGTSSLKLDFIVEDKNTTSWKYALINIEDPNMDIQNAVDKNSLLIQVLHKMGWKVYLWNPLSWSKHHEEEKRKLLSFLNGEEFDKSQFVVQQKVELNQEKMTNELWDEYPSLEKKTIRDFSSSNKVIEMIRDLTKALEPLSIERVYSFLASYFNRSKVTNVVRDNVDYHIKVYNKHQEFFYVDSRHFLWINYRPMVKYRKSNREIEEIALEEIKGLIYLVLKQNESATKDGLYESVFEIMNYEKKNKKMKLLFDQAFLNLCEERWISQNQLGVYIINKEYEFK